jgi:Leucine-rich repeat (LRR) protein
MAPFFFLSTFFSCFSHLGEVMSFLFFQQNFVFNHLAMKKLSRITIIFTYLAIFNINVSALDLLSCEEIDQVFTNSTTIGEVPACNCYHEHITAPKEETLENDHIWIGCTGQNLPVVFRTLNSLNETFLSRLIIWNSLVNILPSDMFAKVRPREVSIESSMLAVFRRGAFDKIGRRLKVLNLRENIIKNIEPFVFKELTGLETLDLSKNKIVGVSKQVFAPLKELNTLLLDGNQLSSFEDGMFEGLTNLRTLNLANNKLTTIKRDTFKGLVNLETLNLVGNSISNVDWAAFAHMKRLRILNLGGNQIKEVSIRGFDNLQQLFINNNLLESLQKVSLRDLPNLTYLSLDRNMIQNIGHDDFSGLGQSIRLMSISLAENQIYNIDGRAFDPVHQIIALSLQNNFLKTLKSKNDQVPFLRPLKKLKSLFLTGNGITTVADGDLTALVELKELSLDQNKIEKIDKNAFRGLKLKKLFLNENALYYLNVGTFDDLNPDELEIIDLSGNNWECVCGKEWIGIWLKKIGTANSPLGSLGCLENICPDDEFNNTYHPLWITGFAICLTGFSIVTLFAIMYLLFQEGRRHWPFNPIAIRQIGSDKEKLISDSMTFPNPATIPDANLISRPSYPTRKRQDSTNEKKKVRFSES